MGLNKTLEMEKHEEFVSEQLENAFVNLDESEQIAFVVWTIGYLASKGISI